MREISYPFPKANPRHRLAGLILDVVLYCVTLGIGWFIWSLVVWGRGQTPGKQVLKMRVYDKTTGRPVRWGHMLIRQYLITASVGLLSWLIAVATGGIHYISAPFGWNFGYRFMLLPGWGRNVFAYESYDNYVMTFSKIAFFIIVAGNMFSIVDSLWIFRNGERHRLVDLVAKTDVLNEAKPFKKVQDQTSSVRAGFDNHFLESRITREIREANELFKGNLISEEEYQSLKNKIITGIE